jgi:hypothetical protein
MPMILYIVLNCITGYFVPNSSDKISVFPKLTTPKLSFNLRIFPKNLLRTHTFDNSYNITYRISRRNTREYMNVILTDLQLHNLTVSYCQNLLKQLANCFPYFAFKNKLPIFRCPHQMISRIVNCMAQTFYAHAAYYTKTLYYWNPFLPVLPHGVSRVNFS